MGMEHRWGTREPAQLDVLLDCRPRGLIHGRLRDLSSSGLFVAISAVDLPLNAQVEVVCVLQDQGVARIHRLEAIVARRAPQGVGLAFSQLNPQGLSELRAFLEARRSVLGALLESMRPPAAEGGASAWRAQPDRRERIDSDSTLSESANGGF